MQKRIFLPKNMETHHNANPRPTLLPHTPVPGMPAFRHGKPGDCLPAVFMYLTAGLEGTEHRDASNSRPAYKKLLWMCCVLMLSPTICHPSALPVPISTLKMACKYLKSMLAITGRKYSTLKSGRDFRLSAKR